MKKIFPDLFTKERFSQELAEEISKSFKNNKNNSNDTKDRH